MPTLAVGVVLDSATSAPYHLATLAAIDHAAQALATIRAARERGIPLVGT